jgi:DNA modification methylase
MPRKKQTDIEQPELIAEEAGEYRVLPDEEVSREEYRKRLAELLKDPEFRKIEGFPLGEDETILALSDPPFYTACPNPFLNEIVDKWRKERAALRDELGLPNDEPAGSKYVIRDGLPTKSYHREPFAADISEGKNDPIYNAHSYHTKVPHKAIMRYILHYTDPGDVVLDGFCGTGMTGIAAQLCGDQRTIESLGYSIKDGVVGDDNNKQISRLGKRKAILNDISPAATFISYNYNTPIASRSFERDAKRILKDVELECGWIYDVIHTDGKTKGKINYTIWSDVFICPNCSNEMVFWEVAVDQDQEKVKDVWNCPKCGVCLSKNGGAENSLKAENAKEAYYNPSEGKTSLRSKQVPVLINYQLNGRRYEKKPTKSDLESLVLIQNHQIPNWFPTTRIDKDIDIWYERDYKKLGLYSVDGFFTKRNLYVLSILIDYAKKHLDNGLFQHFLFGITGILGNVSRMNRWPRLRGPLAGTLYIPGINYELNVITALERRINILVEVFTLLSTKRNPTLVSTQSTTGLDLLEGSCCDYIFTDPPFGSNIIYSDLSIILEAWLGIFTNTDKEAVVHRRKKKNALNLYDYQDLMSQSFQRLFHLLKPGHWITIEFHNTQNSVWNAIQESLLMAGFMVADIKTLDKQQGTFKQVTTSAAVKQDLFISAYKPAAEFENKFLSEAGSSEGAWNFIRQHLEQLPLPVIKNGTIETLQERLPFLLYDRMVAFHIQRGLTVPFSAPEFYQGLSQRFLEREGMVFTAAQAAAYDKLRLQAERVELFTLFVTDENSARRWLRQELEHEPKTYGDLQPKFVQQLHQSKYEDLPELKVILEQSFLQDEKERWYVPDPERAADLEKLRQNALLREFNEYRRSKGRLKVFRSEAIRAGFSHAWREREYETIVEIAERMPESVLQEDQQLLMYYHNASLRRSSQPKQDSLL